MIDLFSSPSEGSQRVAGVGEGGREGERESLKLGEVGGLGGTIREPRT